ncbi:MAG: NAD-binding protein [Phascolarctobacterium sp.]|nr:NAD-binding protein [Phascolarctobacterium sp.]
MIIVFKPDASEEAKLRIRVNLENQGFIIHESRGANITLFGIVGDTAGFDKEPFLKDEAVEQVVEITKRGRSTKWEQLKFAIIGMGLIGGSYAKALRNLGVKNIIAVEIDKEVCLQVQRLGLANLV